MVVQEEFDHDDCPKCGTPSVPGENVSDQALRYCPKCHHDWFEDFNRAPKKGKWGDDLTPDEQKTCYQTGREIKAMHRRLQGR